MVALPKAWVYGRSLTGIAGSNPARGGMDAYHLRVLCVVRYKSLSRPDHSSKIILQNVVCLSAILKQR